MQNNLLLIFSNNHIFATCCCCGGALLGVEYFVVIVDIFSSELSKNIVVCELVPVSLSPSPSSSFFYLRLGSLRLTLSVNVSTGFWLKSKHTRRELRNFDEDVKQNCLLVLLKGGGGPRSPPPPPPPSLSRRRRRRRSLRLEEIAYRSLGACESAVCSFSDHDKPPSSRSFVCFGLWHSQCDNHPVQQGCVCVLQVSAALHHSQSPAIKLTISRHQTHNLPPSKRPSMFKQ
jgi:hypothetical protein